MTVIDAITIVLQGCNRDMTVPEIYKEIIKRELYDFRAKQPVSIVNSALRRHCQGVEFSTASPIKYFKLTGKKRGKNCYNLIDQNGGPQQSAIDTSTKEEPPSELLPEERIVLAHKEHCENVKAQLLGKILDNNPAFFEKLVLKLLLAMGYGYSADSGITTGGPNDKGIDGIIDEDRLGFSQIYIQAKRYSEKNKVYAKELKEFVGSMMVDKGVFITTSSFHKNAINYAKEVVRKGTNLKIIDGSQLVELMLRHGVGVSVVGSFNTYVVDTEYFSD